MALRQDATETTCRAAACRKIIQFRKFKGNYTMPDLYLQQRFELITAPATELVTFTDANKQMRIAHSDDDALIARLINVALAFVDVRGALAKAMITQTWGEWLAPNPSVVYLS